MNNLIYIINRIVFGRKLMDAYNEAAAHDLRMKLLDPKKLIDKNPKA